ncbi:hypothetical protein C8J56DRAFT_251049 [Mycena floridula]|nr:hypothetical protein C8J56DRAFT_251049 [Mycena floridula]
MLKFQTYARTGLRSGWAQHVRLFSSPIPQASSNTVLVKKQTVGHRVIDPTTVRDHFQHFGDISRIWSVLSVDGAFLRFASLEQAQKLLDLTTDGELTTESGETYQITPADPFVEPPASRHMLVITSEQNTKDADIQNTFSAFGPIEKVTLDQECPAIGRLPYTTRYMVDFTNMEDAIKASSTLVSLPNGAVLQTRMIPLPNPSGPTKVLQVLVEQPQEKIRPYIHFKKFVEDLARAANVPRDELRWKIHKFGAGIIELILETGTVEDAQKIKAIQPTDIPNVSFLVRVSHTAAKTERIFPKSLPEEG